MNYLAPFETRPAAPILISQTEVIWQAPREFRNFMSTRRLNLVAVLDDFVTGWAGMIQKRGIINPEFQDLFERVETKYLAEVELLKKAETDPVSLIMPTELWELTFKAVDIAGKSCQQLLLVIAAREIATRDELAEAFAQMRADNARKLAEATAPTGKVLTGPWNSGKKGKPTR